MNDCGTTNVVLKVSTSLWPAEQDEAQIQTEGEGGAGHSLVHAELTGVALAPVDVVQPLPVEASTIELGNPPPLLLPLLLPPPLLLPLLPFPPPLLPFPPLPPMFWHAVGVESLHCAESSAEAHDRALSADTLQPL